MRKSEQKAKKKVPETLDSIEIQLDTAKVEAATKLLPPIPKRIKIKKEPVDVVSNIRGGSDKLLIKNFSLKTK